MIAKNSTVIENFRSSKAVKMTATTKNPKNETIATDLIVLVTHLDSLRLTQAPSHAYRSRDEIKGSHEN